MRGVSNVEFMTVLLMLCIAVAISWPYLMKSSGAGEEAKAIGTLKAVHEAERDFYGGRQYYGDEQQLKSFGALNAVELRPSDKRTAVGLETELYYTITISVGGGRTRWCAVAVPSIASYGTITVDGDGKIRRNATCIDGEVQ